MHGNFCHKNSGTLGTLCTKFCAAVPAMWAPRIWGDKPLETPFTGLLGSRPYNGSKLEVLGWELRDKEVPEDRIL